MHMYSEQPHLVFPEVITIFGVLFSFTRMTFIQKIQHCFREFPGLKYYHFSSLCKHYSTCTVSKFFLQTAPTLLYILPISLLHRMGTNYC